MSVILKRSDKHKNIGQECPYGCCGYLNESHGRDVVALRRAVKRGERQRVAREVREELNNDDE